MDGPGVKSRAVLFLTCKTSDGSRSISERMVRGASYASLQTGEFVMRSVIVAWVLVAITGMPCLAEDPVVFGHGAVKAAVEDQLWMVDPTPTDMLGLVSLSCIAKQVDSLEGLQHASNLRELRLSDNNRIQDISLLSGLKKLEVLVVNQNQIRDISVVADLPNLRHLDVHHNGLEDISAVADLVLLERLVVRENSIHDLQPLARLSRLKFLMLNFNPIHDIDVLAQLEAMETLNLHGTLVSDISPLLSLPQLRQLRVTSAHLNADAYEEDLDQLLQSHPTLDLSYSPNLAPPEGLTGLLSTESKGVPFAVRLYWDPVPSGPHFTSTYRVSRASSTDTGLDVIGDWQATCEFLDTAPLAGCECRYHVQTAVSVSGEQAGPWSEGAEVNLLDWLTLTVSSSAGGVVSLPGSGIFPIRPGDLVTVEVANRNPSQFRFLGWSGTAVTLGQVSDTHAPWVQVRVDQSSALRARFEALRTELYVDANAPLDPVPHSQEVGDPCEDGSPAHPFDSIQEAIEVAMPDARVLVRAGTYRESLDFLGKPLAVVGIDVNEPVAGSYPRLTGSDGRPVLCFDKGETSASRLDGFAVLGGSQTCVVICENSSPVLSHCLIAGNGIAPGPRDANDPCEAAVYCYQSEATFKNCTIADNVSGMTLIDSPVHITQSIIWGNTLYDLRHFGTASPLIEFSNVGGNTAGFDNFAMDPRFVRWGFWMESTMHGPSSPAEDTPALWLPGDYHLQSESGHWTPADQVWVFDATTSPCIDTGDPDSPVGAEVAPHGGRINLGAYGGTAQASHTPLSDP